MSRYSPKVLLMKSSRRLCLFSMVFLIFIFSGIAQTVPKGFTLVAYEGFDYSSGSSLRNAAGGTGWTNPWVKAYQDRFFKTSTTGFTYTGLTTTGLKAEFDNTCYGTCNDIASLGRSLPLQNQGIVYFQFISVFEANGGFGTPNIRLLNAGTLTGGIGSNSGSLMSILDATLSNTASSTASLSAQNLVVIRIDYNLNKTEMWVNPDLSTFDYSNPTSPSAAKTGFSPSFDRMDIIIRSGSIDEISVFAAISPPTSISGTNTICAGDNTTLSSSSGTTGSNVIDVWHSGPFDEAFSEGWDTQPYTKFHSTINSTTNGILNVTTTGNDPQINMYNLGSFDPSVYKYINFRYRVVAGTGGFAQIFFTNSAITSATGGYAVTKSLISDNNWHIATIDMSAHASWTDSNITGWRFDYSNNSGVTMEIDFIQLGRNPIVGTGTSLSVAPTVNTTYSVNRKGPSINTTAISQLVTVNPLPIPTITAQPADAVIGSDVAYTTQSGQSNYVWTIPGILNTDYSITSGGTSSDHTVVLKWLKTGSRAIQINYTNSNNCVGASATSSSSINVRNYGITTNGLKISNPASSINQNGAIGIGKSLSIYGEIMDTPLPIKKDGLTSSTAGTSAKQIKTDYESSPSGIYWISNPNINGGTPFQIYADMTTDGGGWMLLNVGAGTTAAPESTSVTSPNVLGYLPRNYVIELANLSTDVQLRSGNSSTSYAHKTTSTSPLAIGALRSTATEVNGAATWANGASSTFVVNSGTWLWAYCCPGAAVGWPRMYHSSNYAQGVHWFADLGNGRRSSSPDAWFSTWIR